MSGVSTRRVEDLVDAPGIASISESEAGRVVPTAAPAAVGVAATGGRRVLGLGLPPVLDEGSAWPALVRGLAGRGLRGVRLVVTDDRRGLVRAVHEQLRGAAWQRRRVRLAHNALNFVERSVRSTVVRSIFEQPDERASGLRVTSVLEVPRPRLAAVADLLADAEPDLLAHCTFPEPNRRQIRSTSLLERLDREVWRRTAVVGSSPTRASLVRLVGIALAEQDDEWQDGRRHSRPETVAAIDAVLEHEEVDPALPMASWPIRCEGDAATPLGGT